MRIAMPRYQYLCEKCQLDCIIDKKVAEIDKEELCIICGSRMARIPSLTAFHLKGGGWAKDGYNNAPSRNKGG
jgi:putative FmdB family regulatory protein